MDNDITVYGTPSPETPYTTPISTPHRVSYRMNPVKMIRQNVPLKIQPCLNVRDPSLQKDSSNSNRGINPVKTKRTKCVIEPNCLYQDGVGDQIQVPCDKTRTSSNASHKLSDNVIECNIPESCNRSDFNFPSNSYCNTAGQKSMCHSKGDAETISPTILTKSHAKIEVNMESSLINGHQERSDKSAKSLLPEMMKSVSTVEKEIESIEHFVKDNMHRLCGNIERNQSSVNIDNKPENNVSKQLTSKPRNDDCKNSRKPSCKKSICPQESRAIVPSGHECDKKKFYDPQDIRKYMMKKKNERREKEKEEKCKKAKEQAALKRKAEVTKLFSNRAKFLSHRNDDQQETEVSDKMKKIKSAKFNQDAQYEGNPALKENEIDGRNTVTQSTNVKVTHNETFLKKDSRKRPQSGNEQICFERTKVLHSPVEFDLKTVEETAKYFKEKSGKIIKNCKSDADKIIQSDLPSPSKSLEEPLSGNEAATVDQFKKTTTLKINSSTCLPTELNVLNYKNPYNFLDILKSKVNLTCDANTFSNDSDTNVFITPDCKKNNNADTKKDVIEDLLRKHQKITNTIKLHSKPEAQAPLTLKPELTLSDLSLSPRKEDETFRVWSNKKSDKTFTISSEEELRRKSAKSYNRNCQLKENRRCPWELSGVKPLTASKSHDSTPLTEHNFVVDSSQDEVSHVVKKDVRRTSSIIPDVEKKFAGSMSERTQNTGNFDIEKEKNDEFPKSYTNLIESFSLESLKASNISFSLLDPWKRSVKKKSRENVPSIMDCDLPSPTNRTSINDETYHVPLVKDNDAKSHIKNYKSALSSDNTINMSTSTVLVDLYDQMIKNEDEKLSQILVKIEQQKKALEKHLRSEVFALELHKNKYREANQDENIKTVVKKQRAILLKVTKNILELNKMKKSVIDTVEKRKSELIKQKNAMQERNTHSQQKLTTPKQKRNIEVGNKTVVISNQMNTFFGVSSSSLTSIVLEDGNITDFNQTNENKLFATKHQSTPYSTTVVKDNELTSTEKKDSATSPVHFNAGISIRLDLVPEQMSQLQNTCAQIKILPNTSFREIKVEPNIHSPNNETIMPEKPISTENVCNNLYQHRTDDNFLRKTTGTDTSKNGAVKIKRALSPYLLPSSKKTLHVRRQSSSSDLTFASMNDTTTTDQSDVEIRISALQEQLKQRKLEAERLRKEEKKLRKEKLHTKEQTLIKQLEAYDQYIKRLTQMLADESNFIETCKPQIKSSTIRKSFVHSLPDKKSSESLSTVTAEAGIAVNKIVNLVEDIGTNTDDSEKHMKKVDSGILVESEVTEFSENIEWQRKNEVDHLGSKKTECTENNANSSMESVIHSEMSLTQDRESKNSVKESSSRIPESENFLHLVNDLQSEVVSLSEQLYSSDFVEDIPEDTDEIPEDAVEMKSEISGTVSNKNNTSVSIEEILSDHYSDSNGRMKNFSEMEVAENSGKSHDIVEEKKQYIGTTDEQFTKVNVENVRRVDSVSLATENAQSDEESHHIVIVDVFEKEANDDYVKDAVSLQEDDDKLEELEIHLPGYSVKEEKRSEERVITEEDMENDVKSVKPQLVMSDLDTVSENEDPGLRNIINQTTGRSSSDGELDFLNVKSISEIESLELETPNEQLSEGEVAASKQIIKTKSSEDSVIEEIKSASSLERTSEEDRSTPKFVVSDENELEISQGFLQFDRTNESEGSDVTDVENPVLVRNEVKSVVAELTSSSLEEDNSVSVELRPVDGVYMNLKQHKRPQNETASLSVPSKNVEIPTGLSRQEVISNVKEIEEISNQIPEKKENYVTEYGMEETDISESLEYDAAPVTSVNDFNISTDYSKDEITDINEDNTKFINMSISKNSVTEFPTNMEVTLDEMKANSEEISREKDRSAEEFLEDYSVPNLLGATFIVNDDNPSFVADQNVEFKQTSDSIQEGCLVKKELNIKPTEGNDNNIDTTMITEYQTPILQALRREQESLICREQESVDKITVDLLGSLMEETYEDLVSTTSRKATSYESGSTSLAEAKLNTEVKVETQQKVDKNVHVEKIDDQWYDKLCLNEAHLREAEELRLQQIKIEKEIEELQAQQHIPPYIYLREIPNKPPPPYMPPSSQSVQVPNNKQELKDFIKSTIDYVCEELEKNNKLENIKLLPDYAKTDQLNNEVATYKRFLFDLTKEIVSDILQEGNEEKSLPWEASSGSKIIKPKLEGEQLRKAIEDKINVLFGFRSKINKEKLIIRWSRKKKTDFIDDLLIQELQEEEREWTNYEKDELIIKNQIAQCLLDELIKDTVASLQDAFQKKEQSRE